MWIWTNYSSIKDGRWLKPCLLCVVVVLSPLYKCPAFWCKHTLETIMLAWTDYINFDEEKIYIVCSYIETLLYFYCNFLGTKRTSVKYFYHFFNVTSKYCSWSSQSLLSVFTSKHFMPQASFYIPWEHQKISGLLIISGDAEETSAMTWVNYNMFWLRSTKPFHVD